MAKPRGQEDALDTLDAAFTLLPAGASNPFAKWFNEYGVLVAKRGKGAWLETVEGFRLLDYYMGFGTVYLGHSDSDVTEAVRSVLGEGAAIGVGLELEVEAAKQLLSLLPSAETVVFTSSSGEALEMALEVARTATGRRLVVFFDSSCHHPTPFARHAWVELLVSGDGGKSAGNGVGVEVLPYNDAEAFRGFMERSCENVAAVVLEPVAHCHGVIPGLREFVKVVEAEARRCGAVLVVDEWLSFPRYSRHGVQYDMEVVPDLTVVGETAANGFPVAALAGRRELLEEVTKNVAIGGPSHPSPLSLAALLASLSKADRMLVDRALAKSGEFHARLVRDAVSEAHVKGFVAAYRSMITIYLGLDEWPRRRDEAVKSDASAYAYLAGLLREKGILVDPRPPGRIAVSMAHGESEAQALYEGLRAALREVARVFERLRA